MQLGAIYVFAPGFDGGDDASVSGKIAPQVIGIVIFGRRDNRVADTMTILVVSYFVGRYGAIIKPPKIAIAFLRPLLPAGRVKVEKHISLGILPGGLRGFGGAAL